MHQRLLSTRMSAHAPAGVVRRRATAASPVYKHVPQLCPARELRSGRRAGAPPVQRVAAPRSESPSLDGVSLSTDIDDLLSPVVTCPHGCVEAIMKGSVAAGEVVQSATPGETLQAIIPRLSKFTGLPVVGATGKVVGVISRKDIIDVRRSGGSLQEKVKAHMTSPAITCTPDMPVQEAGALMLKQKIRRLPVVDAEGKPLGIVSRSDIFKPLMAQKYAAYQARELAAVMTGAGVEMNWAIKYLYDGECTMCQTLKAVLERNDKARRIRFVDISDMDYDPMANMGVEFEDAMSTIHAVRPDGRVLQGTEALRALFDTVGLGWVVALMESPLLAKLVDLVYEFLSKNRIQLSGAFDALVAARRVSMAKAGVEVCGDVDGGCEIEWGDLSSLDAADGEAPSHV